MSAQTNHNPLRAVSLFTGAGGLDIGFEEAGFETLSAVEINPKFAETISANQRQHLAIPGTDRHYFQDTVIFNRDIASVTGTDLNPLGCDIDCVIGGPPCQAFSSAGRQDSIFDHRGTLIYEYLRIVRELQPKTFLFENVRGLVTAKGKTGEPGEVLLGLLKMMSDEGYHARVQLLNSADYGAYQRRVRCFIIGSRISAAPDFPNPTHSKEPNDGNLFSPSLQQWRSLGDFLSLHSDDNPDNWVLPTETLLRELRGLPDGSGIKSTGRKEATRPSGHWGYRQGTFIADKTKPARTVTGSASQDWIRTSEGLLRRLTLKEVAALQGFPKQWIFCGNKSQQFQQVGNAVPTVFGKVLGETLRQYLLGGYLTYPPSNDIEVSEKIKESIKYTKYDNLKNGAYRVNRLKSYIASSNQQP